MKKNLIKLDLASLSPNTTVIEDSLYAICNLDKEDNLISKALRHHFQSGGARSRARLAYDLSLALSLSSHDAIYLACIPELLHNASLIHDDIQDLGEERRNQESLWKKYGPDIALCAGDYLISAAYRCVAELNPKYACEIIKNIHEHVSAVIKGQIDDLSQDKDQSLSDIKTYQLISAQKSGPLLALCFTLPLIYSNQRMLMAPATQAMEHFAIGYQIYDDLKDIAQDRAKSGIKSGVNIVTVLENNRYTDASAAACAMAISHLNQSRVLSGELPINCRLILEKEISNFENKIKNTSLI
jgi:geranylgeranyl pyrophosphate synthase